MMRKMKRIVAWMMAIVLTMGMVVPSFADDTVETLIWSLSADTAVQDMEPGTTGITDAQLAPVMLIAGTPTVTAVAHPAVEGQVSLELSNRSQNWHALDISFSGLGVQLGGTYRFVASGRIGGTGSRQMQFGQMDSPWGLVANSRVTVAEGDTDWTITATLTREQIATALNENRRGLRIQTNNAASATMTIDEVLVYQIGNVDPSLLPPPPAWDFEEERLAKLFEPYFAIGNIYSSESSMTANNTRAAFLHHFNAVTAENNHKPEQMAGGSGYAVPSQFTFANADLIVNWAVANDVQLLGHALVWHSQSPNWLFRSAANTPLPRAVALERMEYYMKTLSEHFAAQGTLGAFYAWDVVNEAIESGGGTWLDAPGSWRTQMRTSSPWYQAFNTGVNLEAGEHPSDFIFYAYYFARKYFPTSILYYNDYNEEIPAKRDAIAQMVEEINAIWAAHPEYDGRMLIEAIGMQSHYHLEGSGKTNLDNVAAAMDRYIATGALVSVSELDITLGGQGGGATYPELSAAQLQQQADAFAQVFGLYLSRAKDLGRVSVWGLTDNQSWRSSGFPVLFDRSLSAKPAFDAIVNLVKNWETPEGDAPAIMTSALNPLDSGERLLKKLSVQNTCNAPMWYSVVDGALPAGVTLHSRTGVLEGTPAADGTYAFTVAARNYYGTAQQPLTLVVGEVEEPVENAVVVKGASEVDTNETFVVQVDMENVDSNVYAQDILITYDADLFSYKGVEAEDGILIISPDEDTVLVPGAVRIIAFNPEGLTGSEPLFRLSFQANEEGGQSGDITVALAKLGVAPAGTVLEAVGNTLAVAVRGIPVASVSLDKSTLRFAVAGASEALVATIAPANASNKNLTWSSSNTAVATVDGNGVVTAVGDGVAVITVTSEEGGLTATCSVTVLVGDLNGNGAIDIGDLAMMAFFYGATTSSDNWVQAKVADLNQDGVVNILDLAMLAKRILN